MQKTTVDLIRAIVSNKLRDLLVSANRPSPQADPVQVIGEIEAVSTAFVDFSRTTDTPAVPVDANVAQGHVALTRLVESHTSLVELDRFFENGNGRGTKAHQDIKRLLVVAENNIPHMEDQPPA